jgi:hypothetical protein
VKERGAAGQSAEYCIDGDVIDRMLQRQQFNIGLPEISVSQKTAIVEIEMKFGTGHSFPISGFPRPLCREDISGMCVAFLCCWVETQHSRGN